MKLIIEDDEGKKTVVPFSRDEITIGREEGNTIRLTERNVSRRHARLLRHNGHIMVEDLGSYNGIRLNGDRVVGQVQVQEGDLIQIGDYDLAVQRDGAEAAMPTPAFSGAATQPLFTVDGPVNGVPTQPLPRDLSTVPALATVADPGETLPLDETDEAHAAAREAALPESHRRQSTSIIRVDNVEQNRPRQVVDIEPEHAPRLVLLNTEFKGREFSLLRTELKIGRTDENDIAIDHRSLSRTHCKIVREEDGEWRVIDLQSANGLLVNGEPYAQAALKHRDLLELGHVQLQFVAPGQTMPGDTSDDDGPPTRRLPVTRPLSAITLGLLLAGGAAYFMLRGKGEPPSPAVVEVPAESKASAEASVQKARDKIKNLEWKEATTILAQAFVGSELHPDAVKLLADLKRESPLKEALEKADGFLQKEELSKAKEQLDLASSTVLLRQIHEDLTQQWTKASEAVASANPAKEFEPTSGPAAKTAAAPVRAPEENPNTEMLTQLADDARVFIRQAAKLGRLDDFKPTSPESKELKGLYAQAKATLEKCIKLDKTYAECHKLLAGVLGNMGDGEGGAREYSKFLELAPNHPQAARVRELLEDYRRKQANH